MSRSILRRFGHSEKLDLPPVVVPHCVVMERQVRSMVGVVLLGVFLLSLHSDNLQGVGRSLNIRMARLPRFTVWAWERREDLRSVDPATTAVAWLDRTVILDVQGLRVDTRRQPLLLPASDRLIRIPVVRIEADEHSELNERSAQSTSEAILGAVDASSSALQIDFDARRSQRHWYRDVLVRVREALRQDLPLSITALASWCSYDSSWLKTLPVDEAVPMLFRMEPDRLRAATLGQLSRSDLTIQESICSQSVGISTHEPWPSLAGKRIYVFPDAGWERDDLKETIRQLW